MLDYNTLNEKQLEAVQTTEGPLLVIAGAGSGKTRVLTYRIAHLITEKNVKPYNILAITFTNKAAKEMKERVEALIGENGNDIWLGTFHSVCVRILKREIELMGYSRDFNIFDESKLDDYITEPFNTHVFRFIPDNYPYHATGGQVTRVELYPNKEDFRYVFGNTNVNSNAYLIDSSLLNEDREIAITDTINDDLEETFTEVYPCV